MSGGHWNYIGVNIREDLFIIGNDKLMNERFPRLAKVFKQLAYRIDAIEHEIDWDFSGDSMIKDDKDFEDRALQNIQYATHV